MESLISKNDKQVLQMILTPNLPLSGDEDAVAGAQHGKYNQCCKS